MKKRIIYSSLSALFLGLLGFGLAFLGDKAIIVNVVANLMAHITDTWYVLLLPGVALVLLIALVILKIIRKERCFLTVFALLLGALEVVVVGPLFLVQLFTVLTVPGATLPSLLFAAGTILLVLALLVAIILGVIDLFVSPKVKGKRKVKPVAKDENDEDDEEEEEDDEEEVDDEAEDDEELEDEPGGKKEKKAPVKKPVEPDRIYHVMKRKKDEKWVVKIAQSGKAIKVFETQKKAVGYAETLAENNNGVVKVFASKGANKGKIIR